MASARTDVMDARLAPISTFVEPNRLQRFFLAVLPRSWGERMRRDSKTWTARCLTCGRTRSVWDAGGIRWGARSAGKRTMVLCDRCGRPRMTAIERPPDVA